MCLALPGEIVELREGALPMALVRFGTVRREVCLAYVPDAVVGDWVIVHVGFAIQRFDEDEARRTLALLEAPIAAPPIAVPPIAAPPITAPPIAMNDAPDPETR